MNAREHYDGDSDGLSDPEVLVGLIKVINPAYVDPGKEKLKTIVNNYKRCENRPAPISRLVMIRS